MSPFFTKTGDDGTTGLLGNKRVDKSDLRIEVLGSMDELSASIGMARSIANQSVNDDLKEIQIRLYEIMSEVAAVNESVNQFEKINNNTVDELETKIEQYSQSTRLPNEFILSGDIPASAAISVARTVARRAERRLVALSKQEKGLRKITIKYLNRLSSFLYILEIYVLQNQGGTSPSLANKKDK